MAYISQYQYYENGGAAPENENWGSYQYTSLYDIVNNFMLMFAGNHSLVNNEERFKILFHAKRAVQELNYDAFKEIKVLELAVNDQYRFVVPSDYVNWVRISVYKNGILYPLTENMQVNYASAYLQDHQGKILFDEEGNALSPEFSDLEYANITGGNKSIYLNSGSQFIDKNTGVINFSSDIGSNLVILEYVSDGMEGGDDSKVSVNKMFEEYLYAYIEYAILNSKLGVQEYVVRRVQKRKNALLRNAKIRISNIHSGRLLMSLRGRDKWIK